MKIRDIMAGMRIRGFTLIELMVVLAIVVLISLVILVSTSRFNSAILLRSLAYQVGLSVREAQLYGVAVHKGPNQDCAFIGGTSNFCVSYGVHFVYPMPSPPLPSYVIFADSNNNGVDDDVDSINTPLPPVTRFTAQYGFTTSNICVLANTGIMKCATTCPKDSLGNALLLSGAIGCTFPPTSLDITSLDIAFKRPNPDAIISINGDSTNNFSSALIVVSAPGGATRAVSVSLTGQIVVTGN